jgi:hypothetical protein
MPRKPGFYLPEVPVHIVQWGHCRAPVFFEDQDYATYLYWLSRVGWPRFLFPRRMVGTEDRAHPAHVLTKIP